MSIFYNNEVYYMVIAIIGFILILILPKMVTAILFIIFVVLMYMGYISPPESARRKLNNIELFESQVKSIDCNCNIPSTGDKINIKYTQGSGHNSTVDSSSSVENFDGLPSINCNCVDNDNNSVNFNFDQNGTTMTGDINEMASNFSTSMTPSTTAPSTRDRDFANWVYNLPETCKENPAACLRYENLRYHRTNPSTDY